MRFLIILFSLFATQLQAQPGGGGGMEINHIFDKNIGNTVKAKGKGLRY